MSTAPNEIPKGSIHWMGSLVVDENAEQKGVAAESTPVVSEVPKEEAPKAENAEASDKLPYYLGAHVSSAGGLWNAPENASLLGATAFALFLKWWKRVYLRSRSQRQWAMKEISAKDVAKFKETMTKCGFKPNQVLPHGSYLCNIGSIDEELYEKAKTAMLGECRRVEELGLQYLNIHPGSTAKKCTKEESIDQIVKALDYIHENTKYMTIVLENTAGGGGTVGVSFEELKSIIDKVKDKSRVGVCIDTCHAFASGMNIAVPGGVEAMIANFDKVIGLKYLKAMHLNDSKGDLSSNRDVHQPIGDGEIGLDCFRQIMNCDALRGIPLILETPHKDEEYGPDHGWAKEIATLRGLIVGEVIVREE